MEQIKTEIRLPFSLLATLKVSEDQLDQFIRCSLAVELYREGKLSLGKASELAGLNRWEMIRLLSEKNVPLDYNARDAEKDLKTLKEAMS
jgi:predicted HTH domain antitoxin